MTAAAPRSWLFVPGDHADRWLPSAISSGADAIILDLEDGIVPDGRRAAREQVVRALDGNSPMPLFVRVNPRGSSGWSEDIAAVASGGAAGIVLPKCTDAGDVTAVTDVWAAATPDPIRILPLLETPAGILAAASIATASPAVIGLAFGAEDLAASMGLIRSVVGDEILVARSLIALAAAAAGRWAIDTPCLELDDLAAVEADTRRAAALGFDGKLAVHPAQVRAIHEGFVPSPAALAEARAVLSTAEVLARSNRGVGRSDGRMVDAPVIAAARDLVRQAEMAPEAVDD